MKINKIMASLIAVMGSQLCSQIALADQIIQKPYGAFYIVNDHDAEQIFDRNNFGFFVIPPSVDTRPVIKPMRKTKKHNVKKLASKKTEQCPPTNCPVKPLKPVTTVEPAESIFLRLESMKK
ncbi:hypothetical protein AB6896_00190 [Rahnella inusitata]|uniref:hypothetical protein n=1 Tax=Yersiniaceae TaxID=1903411 RepID=UPI0039BDAFA2